MATTRIEGNVQSHRPNIRGLRIHLPELGTKTKIALGGLVLANIVIAEQAVFNSNGAIAQAATHVWYSFFDLTFGNLGHILGNNSTPPFNPAPDPINRPFV